MTTTTTTIDLTELGEALPHDVPKILINIDDGEFEWIFAAHETINMIKVFTVHAQQYNMLPMSFCYTMSNYQLSGRETPQTLGLRAEDVIIARWLPDVSLAINSFESTFAFDPTDTTPHLPHDDELESIQSVRDEKEDVEDDEGDVEEVEEDVEDEEGETLDDDDVDDTPFDPEEWPERIQQIRGMMAAYDAKWGKRAIVQQQADEQCEAEDQQNLQTVKDKDEDVEMTD